MGDKTVGKLVLTDQEVATLERAVVILALIGEQEIGQELKYMLEGRPGYGGLSSLRLELMRLENALMHLVQWFKTKSGSNMWLKAHTKYVTYIREVYGSNYVEPVCDSCHKDNQQ